MNHRLTLNLLPFTGSVRRRLPLTYAAIALLVAISLGIVLFLTLRTYYEHQEREYLVANVQPISDLLGILLDDDHRDVLERQVNLFSFLTRSRVAVYDAQGDELAVGNIFDDSTFLRAQQQRARGFFVTSKASSEAGIGFDYLLISPREANVIVDSNNNQIRIEAVPTDPDATMNDNETTSFVPEDVIFQNNMDDLSQISVIPSVYGYDLNRARLDWEDLPKSNVMVELPIRSETGETLGTVQLSNGPAYGVQAIEGVMVGWLLASVVSITLAIFAGWLASRDVLLPLQRLTDATQRMAAGDLATRVLVRREDEFGTLSQSFNEMAQRIEDTVQTLRRFVSDAAHEINTPITALRTNLELLPSSERSYLRALEQVTRLEKLTANLLHLSRLETQFDSAAMRPLDIVQVSREVLQFHASAADQRGVELHTEGLHGHAYVMGDALQLRQALSNLVHNAIKFTNPPGQVAVAILHRANYVEIRVDDTGIGIPADDLPQLFSRFHRGRNTASYPGSGLGLAIAQTIVQRHGGSIAAENTETGARFTVKLPLSSDVRKE